MTKQQYTLEEWRTEAAKRFGPVKDGNWSFICPSCGHIQSPAQILATGKGDPNRAYSECYGAGCDWKAYGLFAGPVTVLMPDGENGYAFDFAPTMAVVPPPAPQTNEQGYFVWKFDTGADRYWVAAKTSDEALSHMRSQSIGSQVSNRGRRVQNLDIIDMVHGDVEDGEEEKPCSLRDLLKWELEAGKVPPMIIASTDR